MHTFRLTHCIWSYLDDSFHRYVSVCICLYKHIQGIIQWNFNLFQISSPKKLPFVSSVWVYVWIMLEYNRDVDPKPIVLVPSWTDPDSKCDIEWWLQTRLLLVTKIFGSHELFSNSKYQRQKIQTFFLVSQINHSNFLINIHVWDIIPNKSLDPTAVLISQTCKKHASKLLQMYEKPASSLHSYAVPIDIRFISTLGSAYMCHQTGTS